MKELMVNDDFIEKAYSKIFENKIICSKLFPDSLDMGLVSSNNLDCQLLEDDGFGYTEKFNS